MARKQGDFKFKSKDPQLQLKAAKTRRSSGSDSSEVLERQMQERLRKWSEERQARLERSLELSRRQ